MSNRVFNSVRDMHTRGYRHGLHAWREYGRLAFYVEPVEELLTVVYGDCNREEKARLLAAYVAGARRGYDSVALGKGGY